MNSMDSLRMKIVDLTDDMIVIDQQKQAMLLYRIDHFEGYPALGFFHVRKDLLTSIFASCVTYFIILIQFRISVDTGTELQTNITNLTNYEL